MATAWCWFGCQGKPTRAGKQKQNGACWAQTLAAGATQRTAALLRNLGSLANRTLLNETRQPWPQKLSMTCTRTQHGVVQYVNLANCTPVSVCAGSCITSALSAGTPAPTCNDMRKRCSESARPILQRQTRQLQANRTHESHCQLCHARVPNLALRAWTCGTTLAKWVVLGTEPCSAKPGSHGLKHVL